MPRPISSSVARAYLLRYHYLLPPRALRGPEGILAVFDRLRCIQVDPIDTVGRNANLVLQSRIAGYRPARLDRLIHDERGVVESWDKQRSLVRAGDWPFLDRFRRELQEHHRNSDKPPREILDWVLSEIDSRGPLTSLDLDDQGQVDWRWAPAKTTRAALDILFDMGEIGIVGRIGSRKIYGRMRDVLPHANEAEPTPHRSDAGSIHWHVRQRVHALGLAPDRAGDGWLGIAQFSSADRARALAELEGAGDVTRLRIEGVKAECVAPAKEFAEISEKRSGGRRGVSFIAPLDNLIWDRKLIRELFGFDYTWEVYKPVAKRTYGYYVLPVLYGQEFVARWEPKREASSLTVKGWWWETGKEELRDDPVFVRAFRAATRSFMEFHKVSDIDCAVTVAHKDRGLFGLDPGQN